MTPQMLAGNLAPLCVPRFASQGRGCGSGEIPVPKSGSCGLAVPAGEVRTRILWRRCLYPWSILVLLPWLGSACFGQTVRVRVLNCTDGHSLPKQQVSLTLLREKGEQGLPKRESQFSLETDANGLAQFSLPKPAPPRFEVDVHLTSKQWSCGCFALLKTEDVIRNGFVEAKACRGENRSKVLPKAEPGEVLFLVLPPTWWQKFLWPLTKE